MEFWILGPREVHDGDRLVPLPRPKHRALLAALLLGAGEDLALNATGSSQSRYRKELIADCEKRRFETLRAA